MRCKTHIKTTPLNFSGLTRDLDTSQSDSENDFQPSKKKKKVTGKGVEKQNKARKVATPGTYDLVGDREVTSYSDDILATHNIESFERMNSINITETATSVIVDYGQEDEERIEAVTARIASGMAKVAEINGEKVIMNISPKSPANLLLPSTHPEPSGSKSDQNNPSQVPSKDKLSVQRVYKGQTTKVSSVKPSHFQKTPAQDQAVQKNVKPQVKGAQFLTPHANQVQKSQKPVRPVQGINVEKIRIVRVSKPLPPSLKKTKLPKKPIGDIMKDLDDEFD